MSGRVFSEQNQQPCLREGRSSGGRKINLSYDGGGGGFECVPIFKRIIFTAEFIHSGMCKPLDTLGNFKGFDEFYRAIVN